MLHKSDLGPFYGDTIKLRRLAGLSLRESRYPPRLMLKKHAHEYPYFCFVLKGSYSEMLRGQSRDCGLFSLTLQGAGEIHTNHFHESGGHLFSVELEPQWVARLKEYSITLEPSTNFCVGSLPALAMRLYREFRNSDHASALAIEALGLELMVEASRSTIRVGRRASHIVKLATEFLEANLSEHISLATVAEAIGTHPAYLARAFRQRHGCSVGEYLRQLRIEFACRQMASSETSLSEIALAAGFSDQAHFSRTFRNLTRMTPTQYRSSVSASPVQSSIR
jgi:AraC family transcriptional regulator